MQGRAGRRDSAHRDLERVRRGRALREGLGFVAATTPHLIYPRATRRAESWCRRRDTSLGIKDEHEKVRNDMTTFTATSNLLEPGKYGLELTHVGEVEQREYGPTIKLTFRHTNGELKGSEWQKTFKASMKEGSSLRGVVEGFLERGLKPGEPVDLDTFLDWRALVKISKQKTNTGTVYNQIDAFIEVRKPGQAPPAGAVASAPEQPAAANGASALDAVLDEAEATLLDEVPF